MADNKIKYQHAGMSLDVQAKISQQAIVEKEFLNNMTGEIRSKKSVDAEINSGEYIVDDSQYVPLSEMIKRCDRASMAKSLSWWSDPVIPDEDDPELMDDVSSELSEELPIGNGSTAKSQEPLNPVDNSKSDLTQTAESEV